MASQQLRAEGNLKVSNLGVGTNAGVTVTIDPSATYKIAVTHISGSGDAAALVTLETPTGTVVWRKRFAAAFNFSESFAYGVYEGAWDATVSVKISASTTNCEANIAGVQISQ